MEQSNDAALLSGPEKFSSRDKVTEQRDLLQSFFSRYLPKSIPPDEKREPELSIAYRSVKRLATPIIFVASTH